MSTRSFQPLTPLSFLERAGQVHADRTAVVEGDRSWTFEQLQDRSRRMAGALIRDAGLRAGDRVSVLAPNSRAVLESHFGVPMAGGVLNTLNSRLGAEELGYILSHAESSVLLVDTELQDIARHAIDFAGISCRVITTGDEGEYEDWIGAAEPESRPVEDELGLLAINYTSGTTGRPKGVMYAHRGAYLQAMAMIHHVGLTSGSRYLWTLPMFHCNGWCFPWAVTAAGARHVVIRRPDPDLIWDGITRHGATHLSAAPTVLTRLAAEAGSHRPDHAVAISTGGAPPSPALLERLAELRLDVTHLYGLTETYGPAAICDWRQDWDDLGVADQARLKARQGVANIVGSPVRVQTDDGPAPHDGFTIGEVQLRGNNVMLGYFCDGEATEEAFDGEWLRTGDLGVMHPDGYLELRDRSKDIIISGGENIASIEVEQALDAHPCVLESAVVGEPSVEWGETVLAFVTLVDGAEATEADLIAHVKSRISRFKAPRRIVFSELPKTSTGKVQKFVLRQLTL